MTSDDSSGEGAASVTDQAPDVRVPWAASRGDGRASTVATGIGSMPGAETRGGRDGMAEALRFVFGELPDLPYLPELPRRGVGADLTGRGTALLVDMYAEVQPSGWRIVDRPGRDARRASSLLRGDLDLLDEHGEGYAGPLKLQMAGPWTLAATVELRGGDRMLADPGAVRDLAASLAEGAARHVAEVRRRLPAARVVLQLDEPALPGVLAGTVPTASGFGRLRSVEPPAARAALAGVVDAVRAAGAPVIVHCCAPDVPFELLRESGAAGIAFDTALYEGLLDGGGSGSAARAADDAIAGVLEAGVGLLLGVVPTAEPAGRVPATSRLAERVLGLRRLGFGGRYVADRVTVTPSCGLAGASTGWARAALRLAVETARALADVAD